MTTVPDVVRRPDAARRDRVAFRARIADAVRRRLGRIPGVLLFIALFLPLVITTLSGGR